MQQELLNTVKESSKLQQRTRRQAQDITVLQRALFEERAKAKTALSMCNTAHCNHVRSLVARIQSTVVPVTRLAATIQHLSDPVSSPSRTVSADTQLRRALDSKEWTMEDWDSIEDAAICWLEELQSTVSACAEAAERSQLQMPLLQAQVDTLSGRLQMAEASAAASREAEAAATAREFRAQEEAAAAATQLRSLRAALEQSRVWHRSVAADGDAAHDSRAAHALAAHAERRAIAAEAARDEADARAAVLQEDMARLLALCHTAEQEAQECGAGAAKVEAVSLEGSMVAHVGAAEVQQVECLVQSAEEHAAQGSCETLVTVGQQRSQCEVDGHFGSACNDEHGANCGTGTDPAGFRGVSTVAVSCDGQACVPLSLVGPRDGSHSPAEAGALAVRGPECVGLDDVRSGPAGGGFADTAQDLAEHMDEHTLTEVVKQQLAAADSRQEEAVMAGKVMMASESIHAAVRVVQSACRKAREILVVSALGAGEQSGSSDRGDGWVWSNVDSALKQLSTADEGHRKVMEQLQTVQQARRQIDEHANRATHAVWKSVLHELKTGQIDAQKRLEAAKADLAALHDRVTHSAGGSSAGDRGHNVQQCLEDLEMQLLTVREECSGLKAAAATTASELEHARTVEAELTAAKEECDSLKVAAATAATALEAAQAVARASEAECAEARLAAEAVSAAAAATSQSMGEDAAQMQAQIDHLTTEAQEASLREQAAHAIVESTTQQMQAAGDRAMAAETQLAEYRSRCSELSKACLLAQIRVDDSEAALLHGEEVRHIVLRAQKSAQHTVEVLQGCTRRAAAAASRRASEAEAVIADAEQLCLRVAGASSAGGVQKETGTVHAGDAQVAATQQLWLPALQHQMRGLRAAVDEWLQKLDRAAAAPGPARHEHVLSSYDQSGGSDGRRAMLFSAGSTHKACPESVNEPEVTENQAAECRGAGSCIREPGNMAEGQQQPHRGNDDGGQAQTTLDALLSSARELSMLESALQHRPETSNTQVGIAAGVLSLVGALFLTVGKITFLCAGRGLATQSAARPSDATKLRISNGGCGRQSWCALISRLFACIILCRLAIKQPSCRSQVLTLASAPPSGPF